MPENQHHSTPPEKDGESLEARLQRLEAKLDDSVSQTSAPTHQANNSDRSGIGQAFRLSSEFIAGVVVGAGIGFAFDYYFETSPFGMIFFFLIGFCAAVLNVMRAAGLVSESKMRLRPAQELQNQRQNAQTGDDEKK